MSEFVVDQEADLISQWKDVDDAQPTPFALKASDVVPEGDLAASTIVGTESGRGHKRYVVDVLGKEWLDLASIIQRH